MENNQEKLKKEKFSILKMLKQMISSIRSTNTTTSEEQTEKANKIAYYERMYYIKSTNNGGKGVIPNGDSNRKMLNQRQKRNLKRRIA